MLKLMLCGGMVFLFGMTLVVTASTMDAQTNPSSQQGADGPGIPFISVAGSGKRAEVVQWALKMAAHLHCTSDRRPQDCQGSGMDHFYDAGFPPEIVQWANVHCPGCASWRADNYQCVVFVIAAYALVQPLPVQDQNANQYWEHFASLPGWQRLPASGGSLPQPGDIMAWSGGPYGHVSVVLGVDPQQKSITFAQANGQYPIQTLPLRADGSVNTANGYWNAFTVVGYLHSLTLS